MYNNIKQPIVELEPLQELYKGKLFLYLIKTFTNDCINEFNIEIFSIKKSFNRTLTNLLSSWMFYLYADYDFKNDYFFPSNYLNTISLENTLYDLCKYNINIQNPESKINKVITNLKNNYKKQLELLDVYKKSIIFIKNKTNYTITKIIIENKDFYKFNISVKFTIKNKKLLNILNNILLPINIYNKLKNQYTGPENKIDTYLWAIIYRYQLLGSNNHQLAVLPNIMTLMKQDYNLNFECFASSINSTFNNYCSIYYDLERFFGSIGSFFNFTPIKGTYGFNPPYQKEIINKGIYKLLESLDNTKEELTFIITIPIWDNLGKLTMIELYNNIKNDIDYGEFEIIEHIKSSKYFRGIRMIAKEKFTYIDHNFELYKNKTIQNTYVIILSNQPHKLDTLNNYDFEHYT